MPACRKFHVLDLFCGAGGASVGYARAGFELVGVDIKPQPNYPYEFVQKDVFELPLNTFMSFDAIHASPPCQAYTSLKSLYSNGNSYPRLISKVRRILEESNKPWVIENVEGAPLRNPIMLCGTMFPALRVLRHRLFESNFSIPQPYHIPSGLHPLCHTSDKRQRHLGYTCEWTDYLTVTGGCNATVPAIQDAMGIYWMKTREMVESIPPHYTEYIGKHLRRHLQGINSLPARNKLNYISAVKQNQLDLYI